jgi:hypothetical protein
MERLLLRPLETPLDRCSTEITSEPSLPISFPSTEISIITSTPKKNSEEE